MTSPLDWQNIIQQFPDGLMVTDASFTIRLVNNAFAEILAIPASRLVGAKCHQVFAGSLCHTDQCPLTRCQTTGAVLLMEGGAHCKIHNQAPWVVTVSPQLDDKGGFTAMLEKVADAAILHQFKSELADSHGRMRKTMGAIIQAMSMTIEKRDPYTAGHQRRATKLCRAIATELGFPWERIQGLRMAAAIHDLGKIHVPAAILNKPGAMSEHEMAIIRLHPGTAYDILKGIQFPWPLAEIIYQHHERLDGSGYPRQLKGDQILLEARILAVADVVESMASFRPYRPALGLEQAIQELRQNRGTLYDPQVVDVCIRLITEKGFDFQTKNWQQKTGAAKNSSNG
jgi:HD-GYP domain-containing protein (c-di-GMP phosphodiesterase class II)